MEIESEIDRIQGFVDQGNFHAAINIALSALNECRRNEDQAGIDRFIDIIRSIVDTLAAAYGSQR